MVALSDRDSGLETALASEFPAAFHGTCVQHLSENVKSRFDRIAASYTFKLAKAKTRADFERLRLELSAQSAGVATYLAATDLT